MRPFRVLVLAAATLCPQAVGQCIPPTIAVQPLSVEYCLNSPPGFFSVTATGSAPLHYQWRRNGVEIAGANVSEYLDPLRVLRGTFDCVVSNACGSVTSNAGGYAGSICVIFAYECQDAPFYCGCGVSGQGGGEELLYYLESFEAGSVEADCDDGSFTGTRDGGVTVEDLLYWLYHYNMGC